MNEILYTIDRSIDKAISSIDPKVVDRLVMEAWPYIYQFGPGHGVKREGQYALKRWISKLKEGKSALFEEYSDSIFGGFEKRVSGKENIVGGPAVFVSNHPQGAILGNWYPFILNRTVYETTGYAPRWFLRESSDNPVLGIDKGNFTIDGTAIGKLRDRVARTLAAGTNCFLIPKNPQERQLMLTKAGRHVENGGKLAISTESSASNSLSRARAGVGLLLWLSTRNGSVPVIPVAAWQEKSVMNMSFGKSIVPSEVLTNVQGIPAKEESQMFVDYLSTEIARLLPDDKRGFYASMAKKQSSF